MENISALKNDERKLTKQIYSLTSSLSPGQLIAWGLCFLFTRASFFDVLRPFAAAFYVSMGFTGISKVFAILAITIGNGLFANFYETLRQTLALLLFEALYYLLFRSDGQRMTVFSRPALMAGLVGLTGILRGMLQGLHVYDLVVSILSAVLVFSLSVLMMPASETFEKIRKKFVYNSRTLFAKALLLCTAVISLEGIMVWECELGSILASLAVIMIARRKGSSMGACAGALLGLIIAVYDLPASLEVPGMLALAGAAAGLRVKTRAASATLWTLVIIVFAGFSILEGSLTLNYYEALAAGILFILIPQRLINAFSDELAGVKGKSGDSADVVENSCDQAHEAADKLFVLSKALSRVSRSIEEALNEDGEEDGPAVADWIIEAVAEKVCQRCSLCDRCWGTNFLKTYRLVEKAITDLKTDELGHPDIPVWFKSTCTKADKFIEALGSAYSVYKAENAWRHKLNESRMLLAKQASVIAGSILSSARSIIDTASRDNEVEERLLSVANSRGIPVASFRYHTRQESKPYLEAVFELKNKVNFSLLDETIRENLQSSLIRVGESRRNLMGYSVVRYMKQPRFKTATGVARMGHDDSVVSGDSFAFFISNDGYHISVISDGAGSGKKAERYSRTAVQMLENLIDDGVEIGLAVRMLNLFLNLRGENERLATMDICAVDLSSGEASFYKYGAVSSFVKRSHGTEVIPAEEKGADALSMSHYRPAMLAAGDFLVMVSDGVMEAFSEEGESTALQKFIESIDTINAQQLSDTILQDALAKSGQSHDDMTVLVTKLW